MVYLVGCLRPDQRPGIVINIKAKFDDVEVLDTIGRVTVVVHAPSEREADLRAINNVIWLQEDTEDIEAFEGYNGDVERSR